MTNLTRHKSVWRSTRNVTKCHNSIADHVQKAFFTKGDSNRHMKSNNVFISPPTLKVHQKRHQGEPIHLCDTFGEGFYYKHHLNAHLITHISQMPFQCDVCNKDYKYKKNLKYQAQFSCWKKKPLAEYICDHCQQSVLKATYEKTPGTNSHLSLVWKRIFVGQLL